MRCTLLQLQFFLCSLTPKLFFPTSSLELRIMYYGSVHEMRKTLLFHQNMFFLDSIDAYEHNKLYIAQIQIEIFISNTQEWQ